jgi:hypothetical protein
MSPDTLMTAAALLGLALIIATAIHAQTRLRVAQLDTLRRLLASGVDIATAERLIDPGRRTRLLRRGLLLLALGIGWGGIT